MKKPNSEKSSGKSAKPEQTTQEKTVQSDLIDTLMGQESARKRLRRLLKAQKMPSALLFTGPAHVGKCHAAIGMAMALNCQLKPYQGCGECGSCRKINLWEHPDIQLLEVDGASIKIDSIREATKTFGLKPAESLWRVLIIDDADLMTTEAVAALLKTLEEPPLNSVLILCCEHMGRLPETIVSRCVGVHFAPLSPAVLEALMVKHPHHSKAHHAFQLAFAQNGVRHTMWAQTAELKQARDEAIEEMLTINQPRFHEISAKIARWVAGNQWAFVQEWLETWFHDLALFNVASFNLVPSNLVSFNKQIPAHFFINQDIHDVVQQAARFFNADSALKSYHAVLATNQALHQNANKVLAIEAMWIKLKQIVHQHA